MKETQKQIKKLNIETQKQIEKLNPEKVDYLKQYFAGAPRWLLEQFQVIEVPAGTVFIHEGEPWQNAFMCCYRDRCLRLTTGYRRPYMVSFSFILLNFLG